MAHKGVRSFYLYEQNVDYGSLEERMRYVKSFEQLGKDPEVAMSYNNLNFTEEQWADVKHCYYLGKNESGESILIVHLISVQMGG